MSQNADYGVSLWLRIRGLVPPFDRWCAARYQRKHPPKLVDGPIQTVPKYQLPGAHIDSSGADQ